MANSVHICENINDCLATLAWNRYVAVAVSRKHAENSPVISNKDIHCFDTTQNIRSIAISMLTRPRLGILDKLNQLLRYSMETGLFVKWERDSSSPVNKDDLITTEFKSLTWRHFGGDMIILSVGLFICGMVLGFELFVKRMRRAHRRSKFWKVTERLIDGHRYELL